MNSATPGVLVAVDGSAADQTAVDWAAREAVFRGLPLLIVHTAEPPVLSSRIISADLMNRLLERYADLAREIVDAARARALAVSPDLEVDARVHHGAIVPDLLSAATGARIVVIGSAGHLGSVAAHITAHAPCPVVVVRIPDAGEPAPRPTEVRIVVGVDGSETSDRAVGFAFDEASWRKQSLTAVHAWKHVPDAWMIDVRDMAEYEQAAARVLAESLAGWTEKYPDVHVISRLVEGSPDKVLLDESHGAALLVVGSHGRGRFTGMLLGSVSQAVLRHAQIPVAVVRGVGERAGR